MRLQNTYIPVLLYMLPLLLLTGCNSGNSSSEETIRKPAKEKAEQIPPEASAAAPASINRVNLFLETSASMNGYLNGATEFKSILADLVSQLDKFQNDGLISNTGFFLIPRDTVVQKVQDAEAFLNLMKSPKV